LAGINFSLKDFDGGLIGQGVVQALSAQPSASRVTWSVVPSSQFPGGVHEVRAAVLEEHTWVAITSGVACFSLRIIFNAKTVNPGSTSRLAASLTTPNATYDGADAITVFAVEARNENGLYVMTESSFCRRLSYSRLHFL